LYFYGLFFCYFIISLSLEFGGTYEKSPLAEKERRDNKTKNFVFVESAKTSSGKQALEKRAPSRLGIGTDTSGLSVGHE
jgi:hypothetical protein